MERDEELILNEIKALIGKSCKFEIMPNERFQNFHKEFLKFSFEAVNIKIDYEAKQIFTSNAKPLTTDPVRLFDMNTALADKFSYTDLEETLLGCLKKGHLQNHRYELFLQEYDSDPFNDSEFLYA
ncbi:hypothetical protein [Aequorivita xiaoshiensis]|uniref:Uncharacterized protein n=1 Tax=Aequorivita xiaoshiensis TaxID=2874476 RepID=A0A9X1R1M1_9FLAO|nr:hypothetical protein [Aequorivita xiaoshiensis]MCG2431495.1 hypothetical protein [Aequorivita xiaoshiensis]